MNSNMKLMIALLSIYLSACSKSEPKVAQEPPIQHGYNNWPMQKISTEDGTVTLEKSEMSEREKALYRNQYRQTDLIQIPVDPKFNTTLFKIKNVPEWSNTVFFAPKIFAYNSSQGARIAPQENDDGTVTLPFPVILTDGSSNTIQSPNTTEKVNLPSTIAINNLAELESTINRDFETPQKLSALPGCPKRILIKFGSETKDVTPPDLAAGDYCQPNTPFNVALRVPRATARYILEKALYSSDVEVRAVYETKVPFTVAHLSLDFDKSKLFDELERELKLNGGFFLSADLHSKVTNVVKRQSMKISIQGDINEHIGSIVEQAIKEFFVPFKADPHSELEACKKETVCVRIQSIQNRETQTFHVEWQQSTNAMTGQNYITWAKLQPLQDKKVSIGDNQLHPALRNDGSSIDTGLTVVPGDLVEINPSYLVREDRAANEMVTVTKDNVVCTGGRPPILKQRCYGGGGRGDHARECDTVIVDYGCVAPQNQWVKTSSQTLSAPKLNRIDQPVGSFQQIYDGLYLKFTWRKNGKNDSGEMIEKTCPINIFDREGDGKTMMIRLENRPNCEIFSENREQKPLMHLVNKIQSPITYKTGSYIQFWDNRVIDTLQETTYIPIVEFGGSISIRGYSIGSDGFGGQKVYDPR